jgi:hypothetical protein
MLRVAMISELMLELEWQEDAGEHGCALCGIELPQPMDRLPNLAERRGAASTASSGDASDTVVAVRNYSANTRWQWSQHRAQLKFLPPQ